MSSKTCLGKNCPITKMAQLLTRFERTAFTLLRLGLIVVLGWIGILKVFPYEDRGIVPFMANSPFFKWMLKDPGAYGANKMAEGAVDPVKEAWHLANGTYPASYFVGATIVTLAILIALHWVWPQIGILGGLLTAGMAIVTLSFLITTPEVWVPDLGDPDHGFPLLSAAGRLVVKDSIMFGAGLVVAVDSAKIFLARREAKKG